MAYDAFISHSSKDKTVADAATAVLESRGIRCWIAPRDIVPGEDWSEAILNGIEGSRVLVLLFSAHANESQQIKREVERAVNHGMPIIPMRIEDVMPARALEYFISTPHWLDAFTPPLEHHLEVLAETVNRLLGDRDGEGGSASRPLPKPPPWYIAHWKSLSTAAAVVVGLILLAVIAFGGDPQPDPGPGPGPAPGPSPGPGPVSVDSDKPLEQQGVKPFVGTWKLITGKMDPEAVIPGLPVAGIAYTHCTIAAFSPPNASAEMVIEDSGAYSIHIDCSAEGKYSVDMKPDRLGKHALARGMITFMPKGSAGSDRLQATLRATERDAAHLGAKAGDIQLMTHPFQNGGAVLTWVRPDDPSLPKTAVVGSYQATKLFIDSYLPYTGTLTLAENGAFTIRFARSEKGVLEAADGRYAFARSVALGPPIAGKYSFTDSGDRLTFVEPRGTAVWERVK